MLLWPFIYIFISISGRLERNRAVSKALFRDISVNIIVISQISRSLYFVSFNQLKATYMNVKGVQLRRKIYYVKVVSFS